MVGGNHPMLRSEAVSAQGCVGRRGTEGCQAGLPQHGAAAVQKAAQEESLGLELIIGCLGGGWRFVK